MKNFLRLKWKLQGAKSGRYGVLKLKQSQASQNDVIIELHDGVELF